MAETSRFSRLLSLHVEQLRACTLCPNMHKPVVSGGPVVSKVLLVGQAPGDKEPIMGRPFAWTAGKTLFKWFEEQALAMGFTQAACGPMVRSSYHADQQAHGAGV